MSVQLQALIRIANAWPMDKLGNTSSNISSNERKILQTRGEKFVLKETGGDFLVKETGGGIFHQF